MSERGVAEFVGLLFVRFYYEVFVGTGKQSLDQLINSSSNVGSQLWCYLYRFFKQGMIRSPYGGRIIPFHIKSVQALQCPVRVPGIHSLLACTIVWRSYLPASTIYISYLVIGTVLLSYLTLAIGLGSYLPVTGTGPSTRLIFVLLLTPLLGLASSVDPSQETLEGFEQQQEDTGKKKENRQSPPSDSPTENTDDPGYSPAYGYARQSQTDGKDRDEDGDTESIKSQKENILDVAEKNDLGPIKMFTDLDESGFSFDRDGLNKLRDHLEHDPRPILLDRINRFGRDTLETIYVAAKLHYTYDIPIITHRHGKYDLDSTDDQIMLVVEAISAGKSVEDRIRAAWDTIKRKFKEEEVWKSWFTNIRVGYKLPEEKTWPEPAPNGDVVIAAIMQDTIELKQYSDVASLLRRKANNESLETGTQNELEIQEIDAATIQSVFEQSDICLDDIDGARIKRIVTDPIYIGKVEYPRTGNPDQRAVIEDKDLQIVDVELFEEVNDVVERISDDNSTTEESLDVQQLADFGLIVKATEEVDAFRPVCSRCGRGMVKNGTDRLQDGRTAHYWMCPKYRENEGGESSDEDSESHGENHSQRKFPREGEWTALKNHIDAEHPDPSEIVVLRVCPFET